MDRRVDRWWTWSDGQRLSLYASRAATAPLTTVFRGNAAGVTVLLTDDDTLRSLNRQFADEDKVTDVLAFGSGTVFPEGVEDAETLGDIAISMPQARRQAVAAGHSEDREVAMLTAHGVLHLLGYDHAEPDEEREMTGITAAILEKAFQPSVTAGPDNAV